MSRRRIFLLLLAASIAFTAARCDRRQPGEAAAPAPPAEVRPGVERRDVRFPCGDGTCAAWLYLPTGVASPPVVVMGHGFSGTRDVGLPDTAERLAAAGIAALVFDYRHFGASSGLPRQIVDPPRQLEDWRAAIAFARAAPGLDHARIALFGSSLGAGHALTVAAGDAELAAVVAQAPMVDTDYEGEAATLGAGAAARLLLAGWADFLASAFGAGPIEIPAISRSGGGGMIADDGAYAAFEKLVAPGSRYRNAVAARSLFLFDDYNPADRAGEVAAPVLLVASRDDRFVPYAAVEAYQQRAPNVTVSEFEGDHFDVYAPPASDAAADAAIGFLLRHLSAPDREAR
jgi:dienelactone hydrolase